MFVNSTNYAKRAGLDSMIRAHFFCPQPGKKNQAFRSKSSDLPMQILWAFRYNPLRMAA
jgi:hypothetical protein